MSTSTAPVQDEVKPILRDVPYTAARIGIAQRAVWALIAEGKLTSVKIGRRRLVPEWAIEEFVRSEVEKQRAS